MRDYLSCKVLKRIPSEKTWLLGEITEKIPVSVIKFDCNCVACCTPHRLHRGHGKYQSAELGMKKPGLAWSLSSCMTLGSL